MVREQCTLWGLHVSNGIATFPGRNFLLDVVYASHVLTVFLGVTLCDGFPSGG
jgi:hypothetical protein